MRTFIAACVQMTSDADKAKNLDTATRLVEEAVDRGAELVALPELFNCLALPDTMVAEAEPIPGPTSRAMSRLARQRGIFLLAGSIAERVAGKEKVFNTSLLFGPGGEILARYRKIHLFDIALPNAIRFQESRFIEPGDRLAATKTPLGRIGQAICYDLRFPELFRRLVGAGAEILCVPSAFAMATGRDHWEPLLRARAIENQVYVIAPNQYGRHHPTIETYGRSMILDPWGVPLAVAPDDPAVITARIDADRQSQVRRQLPALEHRRDLTPFPIDD